MTSIGASGHTELETVTAGSGLCSIGAGAFAGCTALTDFTTTAAQAVSYVYNDTNGLQDSFAIVTNLTIHATHASELYQAAVDYGFTFIVTDRHSEPTWTWAEDLSSATATFDCNGTCQLAAPDNTVTDDSPTVTAGEDGTVYTASVTVGGEVYSDTKTAADTWAQLQAQINAASDGATITLYRDITALAGDNGLVIPQNKAITLNLNGFILDRHLSEAAYNGEVIMVAYGAMLTLTGNGTITGGKSRGYGGGVVVANGAVLNINGGSITGNSASVGGGVYLEPEATLNMTAGSITGNTAETAGGVYVTSTHQEYESGNTVTRNKSIIRLSGSPVITGNTGGNVYLADGQELPVIEVTAALSNAASIGVTSVNTPTTSNPVVLTSGLNSRSESFLQSDNDSYAISHNSDGEAILTVRAQYTIEFLKGNDGASGSMDPATALDGATYTLPACTFTAPEYKTFKEWSVKIGEAEAVTKVAGEKIAVTSATTATAVWADAVAVAAYSSDEGCTASVADVSVSPSGAIASGGSVTVTAPEKDGWKFMGWYPVASVDGETGLVSAYDANGLLSSDPEYTFNVTSDTSVVAVYRAAVEKVTVKISQANGAQFRVGDSETIHSGAYTMDVPLGTTITATAVDPNKVLHWTNESNMIVGTSATLEITVIRAMEVTLFYNTPNESQSYVQFVTDYGQVLSGSMEYSTSDTITMADAPSKTGYTFVRWVFEGTDEEATPETIKARLGTEDNGVITLKPRYQKNDATGSVSVSYMSGETSITEAVTYSDIAVGTTYTVNAPDVTGYTFWRWEDASGNAMGYGASQVVKVTGTHSLVARYVAESSQAEAAVPTIVLGDPYATTASETLHKVSCVATRSVPEGYTLIEHGMLYARDVDGLTEDTFIYGTDGVGRAVSSDLTPVGTLSINAKVANDGVRVSFRGYMVVANDTTGERSTYYTAIKSGTYNELVNQ